MMKKIISLLLVVCCLLGCGGTTSSDEENVYYYKVYLDFSIDSNLFFSIYDVDVYMDDEKLGTFRQGDYFTYTIDSLVEGIHTIHFKKSDNSTVDGEIKLELTNDKKVTAEIKNHSSEIEILTSEITDLTEDTTLEMIDVSNKKADKAYELLEESGFVNISCVSTNEDETVISKSNWTVVLQNYKPGEKIDKNDPITLTCHHDVETKKEEKKSTPKPTPESEEPDIYTTSNCEDLTTLLSTTDSTFINEFVSKYSGDLIQFDASIDYLVPTTSSGFIYDILFSSGDYSATEQNGPTFKIEDVSMSGITVQDSAGQKSYDYSDIVRVGNNITLTARVDNFDENTGLFYLEVRKSDSIIKQR